MGLVGRKIAQTRTYLDPTNPQPPQQNYEETFPITVFDAVREDMHDENSPKLSDLLLKIQLELQGKQPLFPAKSANYIMTYAGVPGAIGAVQMSMNIPWDPNEQRNDRIPTEKAVGNLMFKLGLVDENGNIISPDRAKVRYSDIIGRPLMYEVLGDNSDGFITQKGITKAMNDMKKEIDDRCNLMDTQITFNGTRLVNHLNNYENPHNVSIDQIGAASAEIVQEHMSDFMNPHQVSKDQVGLGNADNTSDMDKPVSTATQEAIDALKEMLNIIQDDAKGFITNIEYDIESGIFTVTFHNKSFIKFLIPINGLVDEIHYNKESKSLDVYELSGEIKHVDLSDLFIRYVGSVSSSINVSIIGGTNDTGEQIIHAVVTPRGITDEELADQSVLTRILGDQSVTTEKIHDLTITTEKYIDQSITTEKVAINAITNTRLADRAVNGRTLFSSSIPNRVLVVGEPGTDPYYGQANTDMIGDEAVETKNLHDEAVTSSKIGDEAVLESKIKDKAVTTNKLMELSVTNQKMADRSIDGRTLVDDIVIPGTPTITKRPDSDADDTTVPDTQWTMDHIRGYTNQNHNYGDRTVDGRALFSSEVRHRVLAVLRANSDAVWTQVDEEMIGDDAVRTNHIKNHTVTRSKIAPSSIYNEHLTHECVNEAVIRTSAVSSAKIFTSDNANMVLASLVDGGHPVYSKVTNAMMAHNSVSTDQIEDGSVILPKIQTSDQPNMLIGVTLKNTHPQFCKATTQMIADGAVTVDKIHEVPFRDMVLGSQSAGTHPLWTKINGNMILDREIVGNHIAEKTIQGEHIAERAISGKHILQYQIEEEHIAPGAVHGSQLFTSPYPNRVLAVTDPYSKADWLQVDTPMIRDEAVTGAKIFRSNYPYRVLGATQVGVPPEFIKITNDFIMDDTIRPQKLVRDFVLYGRPQVTLHPLPDANGYEIADTKWVRDTVANMIEEFNPDILYDTIETNMIKDHAITSSKLFRSKYPGPRVLGVTAPNEDPEYILIEEGMIADASVTTNKLQRDIHLLGSPQIEIRPSPGACESTGEGTLIPDVQWVLDRIKAAGGSLGGGSSSGGTTAVPGIPEDNSVTTAKIQNRAVTGAKLFTSGASNRVLAVEGANTDPKYTRVNADMMGDQSVPARAIFRSEQPNMILASLSAGSSPIWSKIQLDMMGSNSVGNRQYVDKSITGDKIADHTIGREKFVDQGFVDETLLYDNSVSNSKIQNGAVSTSKLADGAVTSIKLDKDIELKGYPTVESGTNYERRSIRNTILSPNAPKGGKPGDIWIRYN